MVFWSLIHFPEAIVFYVMPTSAASSLLRGRKEKRKKAESTRRGSAGGLSAADKKFMEGMRSQFGASSSSSRRSQVISIYEIYSFRECHVECFQ